MSAAITGCAPDLIIVDPVVSAVAGDSHKNAETRRTLQPLCDLAINHGCAVLGISLFTKGTQGRHPLERITGSLAFGAVARIVMAVAKLPEDDGGGRILTRAKSNIGPDDGGFKYDLAQVELPGYDIEATRLLWGEAVEGTAHELLAEAEQERRPDGHGRGGRVLAGPAVHGRYESLRATERSPTSWDQR